MLSLKQTNIISLKKSILSDNGKITIYRLSDK